MVGPRQWDWKHNIAVYLRVIRTRFHDEMVAIVKKQESSMKEIHPNYDQ